MTEKQKRLLELLIWAADTLSDEATQFCYSDDQEGYEEIVADQEILREHRLSLVAAWSQEEKQ